MPIECKDPKPLVGFKAAQTLNEPKCQSKLREKLDRANHSLPISIPRSEESGSLAPLFFVSDRRTLTNTPPPPPPPPPAPHAHTYRITATASGRWFWWFCTACQPVGRCQVAKREREKKGGDPRGARCPSPAAGEYRISCGRGDSHVQAKPSRKYHAAALDSIFTSLAFFPPSHRSRTSSEQRFLQSKQRRHSQHHLPPHISCPSVRCRHGDDGYSHPASVRGAPAGSA